MRAASGHRLALHASQAGVLHPPGGSVQSSVYSAGRLLAPASIVGGDFALADAPPARVETTYGGHLPEAILVGHQVALLVDLQTDGIVGPKR